ncbi:MAG: M20 family metallopeptidase [Balneolales bacterium]
MKFENTGNKTEANISGQLPGRIEEIYSDVVSWRRYMHRHPELSFQEYETTRWIVEKLDHWGYEVHRPCETGCVAVLKGERAGDSRDTENHRVIALRADIDALPVREQGNAKQGFLSENEGVAHCCGHDVHTSILLGTARLLSDLQKHIPGTVVLIFQAGEEKPPGGGRLLTETGILDELGVEQIFGLHTYPGLEPGQIAIREGPMMASAFEFVVEIHGKGGHAAAPHLSVDPIVIAAQVIQQLQTIVSRYMDPIEATVVTVGKIEAGTARNVIPEKAVFEGTIRTFDEMKTRRIFELITSIAEHSAATVGGKAKTELITGYPPVINHPDTTRILCELVKDRIHMLEKPVMAGEDFAFYLKHIPGTFFFLGSGSDEADSCYSWHHPKYNVDEQSMKTGMEVMASLVFSGVPESERTGKEA